MINTLFWCVTVPGVYIAGMILTYKILRKTLFEDDSERENAIADAMLWVFTVPFLLVVVAPFCLALKLFDMIDGGDQDG